MIAMVGFITLILLFIIQIIFIILKRRLFSIIYYLFLLSGLTLLGETVYRSIQINFIAITNIFEALVLFASLICILLFVYERWQKKNVIPKIVFGGTLISIILLSIASSPLIPKDILPPVPALRSHWLVLHVTFTFTGEAFFTLAFFSSLLLLFSKSEDKKNYLDRLTYILIGIGYPIYTTGALIFGAIWAYYAWGSYWSWDPKETWALITWLTYTLYLHSRLIRKSKGKISAIISVTGYIFTLFTFFGVNFLISGLHSYR